MRKEFDDTARAALKALSPIDNAKAEAFAAEHGFTVHQVRAVAVRADDIDYQAKPKTRKDGTAVESKADLVGQIAKLVGVDTERMETLANANRDVLVILRDEISAMDSELNAE